MKVVLISDVKNLGQTGEVKEVKDGYARNFLMAKGLAVQPTDLKAKEICKEKVKNSQEQKAKESDIIELSRNIDGKKFVFVSKTDEKGNLYGSVGPKEIGEKLGIDTSLVSEHFKKTGEYVLEIKFDLENRARVKIVIEKEK